MSDEVLLILALAAAVAGMAAFALANDGHWRQLLGSRPQTMAIRIACKSFGIALLAISFMLCAMADPVTMAILVWPMLLGLAAAMVAAFLTVKARHRPPG
ncbi:MAG: DUF3325 family protein [Sphingobium sp.]